MIYTVTLSPSLDYCMTFPHVTAGQVNRAQSAQIYPGGKGVNVSILLARLGTPTQAFGFCAGFTGAELCRRLDALGCRTDFVEIPGETRINVKLFSNVTTDLNAAGPQIPKEALSALLGKLTALKEGDTLVLAGAIPAGVPQDFYARALRVVAPKGVRTVVDTSGQALKRVLSSRPFLIKPNLDELGALLGHPLKGTKEAVRGAQAVQQAGARNVLVSLGKVGALRLDEEGRALLGHAPQGKAVNPVGAGDSMVAGFLYSYLQNGDLPQALRMGLLCGSATTFQPWLASKEDILALQKRCPVEITGLSL